MDASEFKEFIFGMLFLKRLSDEFDLKREVLRKKDFAHIIDPSLLKELLEDKLSYGETFFVPVRARWNKPWTDENGEEVPALRDLKHDIGNHTPRFWTIVRTNAPKMEKAKAWLKEHGQVLEEEL